MPLYWYQAVVGKRIENPDQVPHSYAQQMEMWKNYNGPFIVLDGNHRLAIYKERHLKETDVEIVGIYDKSDHKLTKNELLLLQQGEYILFHYFV